MQDNVEDAIQIVQDDADDLDTNKLDKTSVKTTYTESGIDTYSCNYINNINTYSTTEVKTGDKWKDNKPIYRKVIEVTLTNGTNQLTRNTYIPNAETIINVTGFVSAGGGVVTSLSYYQASNDYCNFFFDNTKMYVRCGTYGAGDAYIILEYTKTTD